MDGLMYSIFFGILGVLLQGVLPIALVVFLVVRSNKKKKRAEEEEQRWEESERKRMEEERLINALENARREKEVQNSKITEFAERYRSNPVTLRVAEQVTKWILSKAKEAKRDEQIPEILIEYTIRMYTRYNISPHEVVEQYIYWGTDSYYGKKEFNFYRENLKFLTSLEEQKAFVKAVALCAIDSVEKQMPLDESGTAYELKIKDNDNTDRQGHTTFESLIFNSEYTIQYSCKNGRYVAPKEW